MRWGWLVLSGAAALGVAPAFSAGEPAALGDPVQISAAGKPISVDTGHAAPFVADIDGDGKAELLVGQFDDGKLRIYRNEGSVMEPRFERFTWFEAGGTTGKVPSG